MVAMLTTQQLQSLIEVLDDESNPLEVVMESFYVRFPTKEDYFSLGCALFNLLEDNLFVSPHQKLIAYYILYKIDQVDIKESPFFPIFISALKKDSPQWERPLACLLINNPSGEISNMNAKDVIEWLLDSSRKQDTVDIYALSTTFIENLQSVDLFKLSGVSNSIFFEPQGSNQDGDPMSNVFKLKMEPQDFNMNLMTPNIIRPPPPLLEPSKDEIMWISPTMIEPPYSQVSRPLWFEWDDKIDVKRNFELTKQLLERSRDEKLDDNSCKLVVEEFENDLGVVEYCKLTPKMLMLSLEKNSVLVGEILIRLMDSPYIQKYLEELLVMEISLQLVEVVLLLISTDQLPQAYIDLFVSTGLEFCNKRQNEKISKIFALFLRTLIKNKQLGSKHWVEIENFCSKNSSAKEVQILYRLLKQTDSPK